MKKLLVISLVALLVIGVLPLYGASSTAIVLTIGEASALVNGSATVLDVAPFIQEGRTFVPLRFVVEQLGGDVAYDTKTDGTVNTITIIMGTGALALTESEQETMRQYVENEYQKVSDQLAYLREESDFAWTESDLAFYGKWMSGLEKERTQQYIDAAMEYQVAFETLRYEISSYDVLLPLGRVLLLSNQALVARNILEHYIEEAEGDILGETNPERPITEEGTKLLQKDIEFAQWLLAIAKR
ncbi:MAG: copper amine oxidase N-terminal domain-containing protein [Coprothermobacterota bacterium]|nr:copper amine oxidase N-terminal domain-containing protein [Coprothermobacterota bacterium]